MVVCGRQVEADAGCSMRSTITHDEALVSIGMVSTAAQVSPDLRAGTLVWFDNAHARVNAAVFEDAPVAVINAALVCYFGMLCAMTSGHSSAWSMSGAESMLSTYADLPGGLISA